MVNAKIKVCGMRDPENIKQVAQLNVDYMGFIFYKQSPRRADENNPRFIEALRKLPDRISKVGVFVNEDPGKIIDIGRKLSLDLIQLHGEESAEECEVLKQENFQVMKVIKVGENSVVSLRGHENVCDYLLFEGNGRLPGGNNQTFDWNLMKKIVPAKPYFLSGGISPVNFSHVLKLNLKNFHALDLNSGFEEYPGYKNADRIEELINQVQNV